MNATLSLYAEIIFDEFFQRFFYHLKKTVIFFSPSKINSPLNIL